jgi:D-beta-D-heptose 7-phosphate kinase/D-beta-D-heptose 1-phosphate adenosyltransferase
MRKKGYVFMPFEERLVIMASLKGVANAFGVDDSDETVCEALRKLEPDMFGNGGDRTKENTPEQKVCEELGIEIVFNLGGGKIQSSSDLFTNSIKNRGLNLRQEQYLANYGLDF